ncbi:MAG: hypothetical protein IT372_14230 [Polyangiaceae bacterium]|nr:hypothetical protein [Polyangiaceae bacterium]
MVTSIVGLLALLPRPAAAQPAHVVWAEELIDHLDPKRNEYANAPNYITWKGVGGAAQYSNHTVCSGFITALLKQSEGWTDSDIMQWLGTTGPTAARWHDVIAAEDGFDLVPTIDELAAGDVIAIEYPADAASTGHVAIAYGPATLRAATAPIIDGTWQFEVVVMDSTQSGHGAGDTRRKPDGSFVPGAGMGVMRLYTDDSLQVVGYTWSTYSTSVYRSQATHDLVIGRLL